METIESIRAPRGLELSTKGWLQEAALRMLMNNLDPEVAERPQDLIVYGGKGKAARNWPSFHKIIECLRELENDETLLVQSGKPGKAHRTACFVADFRDRFQIFVQKSARFSGFAVFLKARGKGIISFRARGELRNGFAERRGFI